MPEQVFFIDTFVSETCKGSPTAVCLVDESLSPEIMQGIAADLEIPVTVFITGASHHQTLFPVRYFTVSTEIPACGHATLAAGMALMEFLSLKQLQFQTIEGILIDVHEKEGMIKISYPHYGLQPFIVPTSLLKSLQLENFKAAGYCRELESVFIEVNDPAIVRRMHPDFSQLLASSHQLKEVVVMCGSDNPAYDFLLRSFCPWIGIDEDPVTGSVHSVLAGYWSTRLNKSEMVAYQASAQGGEVHLELLPDRVLIGGRTHLRAKEKILM